MNLRLGNKGLYCVIKLHEVVSCNLGFLAFSQVSFLICEDHFFTLPGL